MARVLIFTNNDIGLYKFRKELVQKLVNKHDVYISLPYGGFIPKLQELGCKFIETPISRRSANPLTDFKLLMKYHGILKSIKPDMVLTYTIKPNVYGGIACRLANLPYISNITGLGSAVEKDGLMQKFILFLYKTALKKASCVFFQNSENEAFFVKKKIINTKYRLIPGSGVNLSDYCLLSYPPGDIINFMFIGRVMKEKGIDQYLDAAILISKKYSNTRFHVLGFCEEVYENTLKEMHEKGIIIYHGMQNDVKNYYSISHCTIHPTYYPEGISNVLLESAACGRPIITTNRSGCREIVDDGVNGYIMEQKNSEDLIKKIEKFLRLSHEDKSSMGLAGRKKVEIEFDRQIVTNAYMEEIENA